MLGSGKTKLAAEYTSEFCIAILKGLRDQLLEDGVFVELLSDEGAPAVAEEEEATWESMNYPELEPIPEDSEIIGETTLRGDQQEHADHQEHAWDGDEAEDAQDEMETPSKHQQQELRRVHINLGHPRLPEFLRALRVGRCRVGIRRWVRQHFHCPQCDSARKPGIRRPAILSRSYDFNRAVGVDLVEILAWHKNYNEYWLNILCWGTSYNILTKVGDAKTAEKVYHKYMSDWVRHYGYPEVVVSDMGGEFMGVFSQGLGTHGTFHHVKDAESPWQNGRTERAGGLLKDQIKMAMDRLEPDSEQEHETMVHACVAAKNAHYDRSGFTPNQRVYGTSHRLPRSLCSDDLVDPAALAIDTKSSFQRSHDIRAEALRAYNEIDTVRKLQKAGAAQHRTTKEFQRGDWVFVVRRNMGKKWREGPGVVVMAMGASLWVVVRGELWKVSTVNCVLATNEEKAGIEQVEQFLPELKESLRKKQRRNEYWDLSSEGPPPGLARDEASTAAPASTRPDSTSSAPPSASIPSTPMASS